MEWAIHCCVVLAGVPPDRALTAARLAELHGIPAAYLAKHLQALARAGIVEAVAGRRGGYRLARSPEDITMLDVVEAVEGRAPAFRCTEIRQRGPVAGPRRQYRAPCPVATTMWEAEHAWRLVLDRRTIADLLDGVVESASPVSIRKSMAWLQEAMR